MPLVYKLLGSDPNLIGIFQSGFSMLSWVVLAICVAGAVRVQWLKIVAFATTLVFSLSTDIVMWDWQVLSESISLSLLALFIASWLWLIQEWHWGKAAIVLVIGFFLTFTRDTNAYVMLMVAGLLTSVGLTWRRQRRYILLAGIFLLFFTVYYVYSNANPRIVYNVYETLAVRVLPFPERTEYFAEQGMPVTPAVLKRAGKPASSDNWALDHDTELQEFRDWIRENGKSTYVQFLLSRPLWTAWEPLRYQNRKQLVLLAVSAGLRIYTPDRVCPAGNFSPRLLELYAPVGFSSILPDSPYPLAQIVYPKKIVCLNSQFLSMILVVGAIATLTIAVVAWKQRAVSLVVPLVLIGLAYPHAALAFHGEPLEIGRHALLAIVQLGVGLWMLLLFSTDTALSMHKKYAPQT